MTPRKRPARITQAVTKIGSGDTTGGWVRIFVGAASSVALAIYAFNGSTTNASIASLQQDTREVRALVNAALVNQQTQITAQARDIATVATQTAVNGTRIDGMDARLDVLEETVQGTIGTVTSVPSALLQAH